MDDYDSFIAWAFVLIGTMLIISAAVLIYSLTLALELRRALRRARQTPWLRQRDTDGRPYRERL